MEAEMRPYIVYVKTDDQNRITSVNSSEFLLDASGWVEIDSGFETKHHHAQGNYFDKPIMDDKGIWRYLYTPDAERLWRERTPEEMDADYIPPAPAADPLERIAALEGQLAAAKILLGVE